MIEEQIGTFRAVLKKTKDKGESSGVGTDVDAELQRLMIKAEDMQTEECIGKGSFGEVFKANYRGQTVAVKTLKNVDTETLDRFRDEILLMNDLKHGNIVGMVGCCWEMDLMALVMEFCAKGTSTEVLKAEGVDFSWDDPLLKWVVDLSRAMKYLHGVSYYDAKSENSVNGIIHRDLKPDNCLVSETYSIKVADFGESRAVLEDATMTQVGTPLFIAPEIVIGEHYTSSVDVFSFALTVLGFAVGGKSTLTEFLHIAWTSSLSEEDQEIAKTLEPSAGRCSHKMISQKWRPLSTYLVNTLKMPQTIADLLMVCWDGVPANRPNFGEISEYLETEAKSGIMAMASTAPEQGGEGGGGGATGKRRTSTSGSLGLRIQARKAEEQKQVKNGGNKLEKMRKGEELVKENDTLRSRVAELEKLLTEATGRGAVAVGAMGGGLPGQPDDE